VQTVAGCVCLLRSRFTRTTGTIFDATEAVNWALTSQVGEALYTASTLFMAGMRVRSGGRTIERVDTGQSAATYVASEWAPLTGAGTAINWFASDTVFRGERRIITIGTVQFVLRSNSNRVTGATFDATEAANWQYDGQSLVGPYVNAVYPTGARILQNESEWQRRSPGTDGATFTAANWERLYLNPAQLTSNGLQRAEYSTTTLAITNADKDYTLTNTLQEGDLLEIQHMFNGNIGEREMIWVRVQAGSTQRQFPWADPTNNTHYFTFPSTLTNKFKVKQIGSGSSPSIVSVKVWRDAANGWVVPTGMSVVTPRSITGSITAQVYEEVDWPLRIPLNSGENLASLTLNGTATSFDAQTGFFVIPKGTGSVAIAHTVAPRAANPNFTNAGGNTSIGFMVPYRPIAVLDSIEFNLRDKRPDLYNTRNQRIIIPMSYFQDSDNNGWTYWRDGNADVIWKDFTLDTSVYRCHIYYYVRPQGLRFWFRVVHSNADIYGYISDFVGKFV
jgi:hypothetical protein